MWGDGACVAATGHTAPFGRLSRLGRVRPRQVERAFEPEIEQRGCLCQFCNSVVSGTSVCLSHHRLTHTPKESKHRPCRCAYHMPHACVLNNAHRSHVIDLKTAQYARGYRCLKSMRAHARAHSHTRAHARAHLHARTHAHTCARKGVHAPMQTSAYAHTLTHGHLWLAKVSVAHARAVLVAALFAS